MTEQEAIKLCQKWQYILPQSYSCENPDEFNPHRWVVEAVLEAANGTPPEDLSWKDHDF